CPARVNSSTPTGIMATRYSSVLISLGTPMVSWLMGTLHVRDLDVMRLHGAARQSTQFGVWWFGAWCLVVSCLVEAAARARLPHGIVADTFYNNTKVRSFQGGNPS